jgi:hypothetical protein
MSTEYYKITFSNLQIEHPEWPVAPATTIYVPAGTNTGQNVIWTTEYSGNGYTDSLSAYIVGGIDFRYHGAHVGGGTNYAKLEASNSYDFSIALANGNLTGIYTGNFGEIWNIEHHLHVDNFTLSSAEGPNTMNPTPAEQTGGVPPNAASSPSPADDAVDIKLVLPQLSWSTV